MLPWRKRQMEGEKETQTQGDVAALEEEELKKEEEGEAKKKEEKQG